MNPKKSNIIIRVRHAKMDVTGQKNQGQKTVFHLGDFNTDLMHYNEHKLTNKFLD